MRNDLKQRRLLTALLLGTSLAAPVVGEETVSRSSLVDHSSDLLEGQSFQGRIRAEGLPGLFSVPGRLTFEDGHLIWLAQEKEVSGPYTLTVKDGYHEFHSRIYYEDGTFVDWRGQFDGEMITAVKALWNREAEDDFIHDLFLSDSVPLIFTPVQD